MILIFCHECNESVITESVARPDCDARQPIPSPPEISIAIHEIIRKYLAIFDWIISLWPGSFFWSVV
jgi:hypothetical protein